MSGALELTEISMINDMRRLDLISNNLANVNTVGYKREIPVTKTFQSVLAQGIEQATTVSPNLFDGASDSITVESVVDPQDGMFQYTGNSLDIAIEGSGFFEVRTQEGVFYTRQGTLSLDENGRLVTANGAVLIGESGEEIRVSNSEPSIDKQGAVWEGERQVGVIKVVSFTDPAQLQKMGGGMYKPVNAAHTVVPENQVRIRQGYIETSNVGMMTEMVQMIEVMRHFETNQRVLKGYDDLLDNAIRTLGDV